MNTDTKLYSLYLNTIFFIYGLSMVLFDNAKYIKFIYLINVILGLSFIYLVLSNKVKLQINTFFKIYLLFVILTITSSFWSDDFFYTARRSLNIVLIFLNIYFIYNINEKYKNFSYLIYGIFTALFVNFLWLLGIIDLGLTYEGWRFQGSVLQANNFVFILMFAIMMVISLFILKQPTISNKFILIFILFISAYMILFTASKSGLFSSFLLLFFFALQATTFKNSFKTLLVILFIYILLSYTPLLDLLAENSTLDLSYTLKNLFHRLEVFTVSLQAGASSGGSTGDRIMMINDAINLWATSPIIGNGLAAFEQIYGHYSHNNMTELLASFGIVGFVLYYSLYVYLFIEIKSIEEWKIKIMFTLFLILFIFFDQSIVSYTGKFKILSFVILFLLIKEYKLSKNKVTSHAKN